MRRHIDAETPAEPDLQAEELHRILKVLLPIRKQRLSRSERIQRAEAAKLRECDLAVSAGELQLTEQQQHYRTASELVNAQHVGQTEALSALRKALNEEQSKRGAVQQQHNQLRQLGADRQAQQQQNDSAQREVLLHQREVEKVEYLLQQHQGNPS